MHSDEEHYLQLFHRLTCCRNEVRDNFVQSDSHRVVKENLYLVKQGSSVQYSFLPYLRRTLNKTRLRSLRDSVHFSKVSGETGTFSRLYFMLKGATIQWNLSDVDARHLQEVSSKLIHILAHTTAMFFLENGLLSKLVVCRFTSSILCSPFAVPLGNLV